MKTHNNTKGARKKKKKKKKKGEGDLKKSPLWFVPVPLVVVVV
jgi:hypothetical protein